MLEAIFVSRVCRNYAIGEATVGLIEKSVKERSAAYFKAV